MIRALPTLTPGKRRSRSSRVPRRPTSQPPAAALGTDAVTTDRPVHPGPPPSDGWVPVSPCGPACVPAAAPPTAWERVREARRLVALFAVLGIALVVVPLAGARSMRLASRAVLLAVGVRVRLAPAPNDGVPNDGAPHDGAPDERAQTGAELIVANHQSWIDVLALNAARPGAPMRMLAKQEVRDWPLVGPLAARCGAVFLDRGSLRLLPATVAHTAEVLRAGGAVAVFPEGTTWCGAAAGPFRHAAFQSALDAVVPVRPVAIVLRGPDGRPAPRASFLGLETLPTALPRVLRLRHVTCEVTLLPRLEPVGTRRELAARAAAEIGSVTGAAHRNRPRRAAPPARAA